MPTIITQTIGSNGADFATVGAWEADSDTNLIAADEIRIGVLSNHAHTAGIGVTFAGATTGPTNYRQLQGVVRYDPVAGTGPYLTGNTDLVLGEGYFRMVGVACIKTSGGTTFTVDGNATNALLDGCYVRAENASGAGADSGFDVRQLANSTTLRNCIYSRLASLTNAEGPGRGFRIADTNTAVYNCSVWNARTDGIEATGGNCRIENNISMGSLGVDFDIAGAGNIVSHNMSEDATAVGEDTGSATSLSNVLLTVWTSPTNHNFALNGTGGGAEDAGTNLSSLFTLDFESNTHNGDSSGWEMGALDSGAAPVPATNVAMVGIG